MISQKDKYCIQDVLNNLVFSDSKIFFQHVLKCDQKPNIKNFLPGYYMIIKPTGQVRMGDHP